MHRYYLFIIGILLIAGCKDVYEPDVESDKSVLVIDGLMTNQTGKISVKLSKAAPFDSTNNIIPVRGALISIFSDMGDTIKLTENATSSFYTNNEKAGIPGHSYFLRVITRDGSIYESMPQVMPEVYKQDSIYGEYLKKTTFVPSISGNYIQNEITGIQTYVDLNSATQEMPKCRYETFITVLYTYEVTDQGILPPPIAYCWKTFSLNTVVTSSKFDKSETNLKKYNIGFFNSNYFYYAEREDVKLAGWLLNSVKYNMTTEAHQYYLNIQKQLEASGKIFDPMPSQIAGNLKCVNHPDKMVFGFFEVSNAENLHYRYKAEPGKLTLVPKDSFPGLTYQGELVGIAPEFWYK